MYWKTSILKNRYGIVTFQCPYLLLLSVIATGYWATGRLALLLAMPPAAAWPPAGMALAATLVCGSRVWPGIVLGSFLVNIWPPFDPTTVLSPLTSIALATSIGVGAALQAHVGACLVRRFVGFPTALEQEGEVITFLVLGGPVSCLIGATWGVTSWLVAGVIPSANALFTWWTWWAGDTIGALVVTPLLLVWTAEPRQVWRRRQLSVALPLGLMFGLVVGFFVYAHTAEQHRIKLQFARHAHSLVRHFQDSVNGYVDALHAIESFYASVDRLSPHVFHTFVQGFFVRQPGLQMLSWERRVPDAERVAYEEAMRREGYPDFQITELQAPGQRVRAAQRPEYMVVSAVEPYKGNESALGYDALSGADRLEALQRARDTGAAHATGQLRLVQETGQHSGLLVYLPIYGPGLPHATVEERRRNLHGYAAGMFRIDDMVEASLRTFAHEGLALRIDDETALAGARLLYSHQWLAQEAMGRPSDAAQEGNTAGFHWGTTFEVAGRRWALQFFSTHAYLTAQRTWYAWAVLASGLLFTGLLGALLLVLTGRTLSAERLAAARTAANATLEHEIAERQHAEEALRQAEQKYRDIFEHAREGIYQTTPDGRFLVANSALAYMLGFDTSAELIRECTDIAQQYYVDPACREEFKRLLEEHGAIQGFEYQAYRRDGSMVWVSNNARAVHDERGVILYYEGIIQDITERKHAEEARQAYSRRLLETQEAERQRIARELHDEIGQVLTAVKISLQIVRNSSKPSATWPCIDESMEVLDEALSRVRELSLDLHPSMLDDLGLPAALRWYVDKYALRTGISAEVMTDGVEKGGRLPREIETPCFRIVQEALTNVARHAHARHVVVHLQRLRTTLRVEIKDDGVGFDTSALKHKTAADIFGLRGMEERALLAGGHLRILSAPSRGTKIRAYFPLRIMEH